MTKKRGIQMALGLLGLFGFIFTGSLLFLKYKGSPQYHGVIKLQGLKGPVSIQYDLNGIPHISGKFEEDTFMALGFAMAQDRLFHMDLLRRLAKGQLAEMFGKKALSADKTFRTLSLVEGFRTRLKKGEVDPNILIVMKAFFKGVNQFIALEKWPFEYTLLGMKPRPFDLLDGYGVLGYMAYSFAMGFKTDPLMESLTKKLGVNRVNELRREPLKFGQERTVKSDGGSSSFTASLWRKGHRFVEDNIGLFTGSNAWALRGDRSLNGSPILASDPHVGFGIPGLWYEAHVKWEKGFVQDNFEYYGHFVPALPFAAMAHTNHHAWAVTISYIDDMDFIIEKLEGDKIRVKGEFIPLKKRKEIILVKGDKSVDLEVLSGPDGPIVTNILGKFNLMGKEEISLRWAHHDKENRPSESFYGALMAKDRNAFEKALSVGRSPGLNVIYADSANNIARYLFGGMWNRPKNMSGDKFYYREDTAFSELSEINFYDRPHLINPVEGVVVSANQRPEGTSQFKAGYFQPMDRYRTIHEILEGKNKWSLEELKFVQTANVNIYMNLYKEKVIDALSTAKDLSGLEQSALSKIQSWQGQSPVSSVSSLIFYRFFNHFQKSLLPELTAEEFNLYCETNYLWHYAIRELVGGDKKDLIIKSFKNSVSELSQKHGALADWSLGLEQTLTLTHPLSRGGAHLAYFLDIGPEPMAGGFNQINNMRPIGCKEGLKVRAGPSTRRLVSLAKPQESWGILPLGNSGHYGSPFFKNQWPLFKKGKYRKQLMRSLKNNEVYGELKLIP